MIIRTEKKSNYTILPNEFLLDESISDKARGTLARLLSRPDSWNLNINHLANTGKEGHTAIRSAIRELERAGYIQKDVSRHENGRIIGVEYIIHEMPFKTHCNANCHKQKFDKQESEPEQVPESESHETGTQIICTEENHMRETQNKETAPIINTDIKQILKETTTTTPGLEQVTCEKAMPSSSSFSSTILGLIPEQHRSPVVITFVNKAIVDYSAKDVEEAVAYAAGNVRGGSMQFRAYLDKALKNKWADGYSEFMQAQGGGLHGSPETASRHAEGRAWLSGLGIDSLKMLANSGNLAAGEELLRRI